MTDTALNFLAYRDLREGAEAAERLILRLREKAFALLPPDTEQSKEAFADIIGELETAPEITELRCALGRTESLSPALRIGR